MGSRPQEGVLLPSHLRRFQDNEGHHRTGGIEAATMMNKTPEKKPQKIVMSSKKTEEVLACSIDNRDPRVICGR